MFQALTESGVIGRALQKKLWQFALINPRDYANNPLGYIDDKPFGGGPGMLMQVEPLLKAYEFALTQSKEKPRLLYMSPQGITLNQKVISDLALTEDIIIVCGRYEGIDERFLSITKAEEVSVGDYVVSGGELPAMLLMDAVLRQLPGVLGDSQSAACDSFSAGLLEGPQYTRPEQYLGNMVPAVLLSGNHEKIRRWRLKQALKRTLEKRPELLKERHLNPEETSLLAEIKQELLDNPY